MENKKTLVTAAVVFLIIGILIGFVGGKQAGRVDAEKQLLPIVNLAFPKPSDDMRSMTGTVMGIFGATINLQIDDPADYLPHLDGSPRAVQTRFANVTPDTKYVFVINGKIKSTPSSVSDVKKGDIITVRSNDNIRDAETFDVFEVDLVR
ncbi:hypothetical protein D4R51_00700 [bacterium]|nr:MAG: hypothetical protein D4R51_00700 [bacterium]